MGIRLKKSVSKNSTSLSIIADTEVNGKRTTTVLEALGNLRTISEKYGVDDPMKWAQDYVKELREEIKKEQREVLIKFSTSKKIKKDQRRQFNGGYLFLQEIYYDLGLNDICEDISKRYKFTYDLNSILSRLIFGRIIFPKSKLATYEESKRFIEPLNFEVHHIYRALEVLASENDFIQSQLYKNSLNICSRNDRILYYDCTNYYFEITQSDGDKQYAKSKENRPNPIVQMGLFMDGNGMPLSFGMTPGNTNEQITLKPLEKKILSDFGLSKFIVCTDAGLSSAENRNFNNIGGRAFITTQSIKKLKTFLKDWALDKDMWLLPGDNDDEVKYYNLDQLDEQLEALELKENKTQEEYNKINKIKSNVYYKERWIKEGGLEQRLIVTYSIKYRNYLRRIRHEHIERAIKLIETNPKKIGKAKQNDFKRLIKTTTETKEGNKATIEKHEINLETIEKEAIYDGYYGVCTNLEDDIKDIIKVNKQRWQIEECFRIMKSEFKARPVFLKNDDRVKAHFMTCFISLMIYRLLESRLNNKFTCREIISTLHKFDFLESPGNGYIPSYTRTEITDYLHDSYDFNTDFQIVENKKMKKIIKSTKTKNSTQNLKQKYDREPL